MSGRVTGVGGFFFRAKDPSALTAWYQEHLGINPAPQGMDDMPWMTEGGVTVFSPFADNTEYLPEGHNFMMNFRVDDLDAILERLAKSGIEASRHETMEGVGRFARIHDPEGNPIELWEPAG